jgi:chromate transporter
LVDPLTVAVCLAAGLLLWRTRLNSAWYVGAGAVIGAGATLLG